MTSEIEKKPSEPSQFLAPGFLAKIGSLQVRARYVVEGALTGLHASRHRGQSVEFAEHREYAPGDEIRHIDWKVFGKSDKYYIKQFEEETNLRTYIFLDSSGSMGYGSGPMSKLEYAKTVAASLSYLMLSQGDGVGLVCRKGAERLYIPPSSSSTHLETLLGALTGVAPAGRMGLASELSLSSVRVKKRGLIMVISDLFESQEEMMKVLRQFRHMRNEVIIFHVLDRNEISFPFTNMTIFEGMEEEGRIFTDPRGIRKEYLKEMREFIEGYRRDCLGADIEYCLLGTDEPLDRALFSFLARRDMLI